MAKKHPKCSRKGFFEAPHHGTVCLFTLLFFSQLSCMASAQSSINQGAHGFNPEHLQQPFNRSMAILLIVVVSIFFCFGCFCVYVRQCTERGIFDPSALAEHGGVYLRSSPQRGLDPTIIKKFPTFQYSTVKGLKIGKRALECAVCLNEFEDRETLRLLPQCNHVFHPECIDSWLSSQITCPVCRANLVPKAGESYQVPVMAVDPGSNSHGPESRQHDSDQTENQVSVDFNDDQERPNLGILPTCSPMPWSKGLRFNRLFTRSHSTGHSLVQPDGNHERFTLRLPDDVRNQLLNAGLKRTKSCEALFPEMRSPKKGFLSSSSGNSFYYDRFNRDRRADRWGFSITPPFITKAGVIRSQKGAGV